MVPTQDVVAVLVGSPLSDALPGAVVAFVIAALAIALLAVALRRRDVE